MSRHPLAELAALVDGELNHVERERTLAHLVDCAPCRAEVDNQRRLKARLRGGGGELPPPPDLTDRLLHLAAKAGGCPGRPPGGSRRPAAAGSRRGRRRPAARAYGWARGSRRAVGGAVLALGLGAVLAAGGARSAPTRTPVDPASDAFLLDYAATTSELPLPDPAGVLPAGARPAGAR